MIGVILAASIVLYRPATITDIRAAYCYEYDNEILQVIKPWVKDVPEIVDPNVIQIKNILEQDVGKLGNYITQRMAKDNIDPNALLSARKTAYRDLDTITNHKKEVPHSDYCQDIYWLP